MVVVRDLGHLAQMPRERQLPEHDDGLNNMLVDLVALLGSQRTACDAQVVAFAEVVAELGRGHPDTVGVIRRNALSRSTWDLMLGFVGQ